MLRALSGPHRELGRVPPNRREVGDPAQGALPEVLPGALRHVAPHRVASLPNLISGKHQNRSQHCARGHPLCDKAPFGPSVCHDCAAQSVESILDDVEVARRQCDRTEVLYRMIDRMKFISVIPGPHHGIISSRAASAQRSISNNSVSENTIPPDQNHEDCRGRIAPCFRSFR